jgi:hypothetical protein
MGAPKNSLLARCAFNSLNVALRFWPENSRRWGHAVLAEMGEITEPAAALRWAAGGIRLFFRALFFDFLAWLKLPAGGRLSDASLLSGGNRPQFPKHSRIATAIILLGAAALLFSPIGQEATATVKASWRGFRPSAGDREDLKRVAAQAETEKDARELAFVALSDPDSEQADHFADRAVELDSNLAWIYASRGRQGVNLLENARRLRQLKSADPENAYVYLASARAEAEPRIEKFIANHGATDRFGKVLVSDTEWMKEMDEAFRAPRYDNYFRRHEQLAREGWKNAPNLSPGLIAIGLWSHGIQNVAEIRTYADLRVSQALQAASVGKAADAEAILREITAFGRGMAAADGGPLDRAVGFGLMDRGLEESAKLYRTEGRVDEAKEIEAQLGEVRAEAKAQTRSYIAWRSDLTSAFRWKAIAIQGSAIFALVLAMAVAISLLVLEAGAAFRWKMSGVGRWMACRVADYGPVLFLVTSVLFLASFRPIARAFEQYRSTEHSIDEGLGLFWQVVVLGDANPLSYFYESYHQWLIGTTILVAVAVIVTLRGLLRRKVAAAGG